MIRGVLPGLVTITTQVGDARACSTCLSGDPTLTTLGLEKPYEDRFRGSLNGLYRTENFGVEGVNRSELTEYRSSLGLAWWPTNRIALGARVPWVWKQLDNVDLSTEKTSALGDIDLDARFYLWQDRESSPTHLFGVQGGVRVPSATEQTGANGQPLDFDVQPGTGIWIPNAGIWYGFYKYPWFLFASSVAHIGVGEGFQGFEFGNALNTTVTGQYAFTYNFAASLSLDTRYSGKDSFYGVTDEDSGGFIAFISPGIVFTVVEDLLLHATGQLPAIDRLNGDHDEGPIVRVGLTYDF